MWNKPQLLNAIADLLYAAAAAVWLTAVIVWSVRVPSLPIRQVVASQELRHVRQDELERVLAGRLAGNFFSVNLQEVQAAVETLPWVRRVEVRRRWPSRLELGIQEHVPVGRWEDGVIHSGKNELVNSQGEVFMPCWASRKPRVCHNSSGRPERRRKCFGSTRNLSEFWRPSA